MAFRTSVIVATAGLLPTLLSGFRLQQSTAASEKRENVMSADAPLMLTYPGYYPTPAPESTTTMERAGVEKRESEYDTQTFEGEAEPDLKMATSTTSSPQEWSLIGEGGCRGESMSDKGTYINVRVANTDECRNKCDEDSTCVAYEYSIPGDTCELHRRMPVQVKDIEGVECWVKESGEDDEDDFESGDENEEDLSTTTTMERMEVDKREGGVSTTLLSNEDDDLELEKLDENEEPEATTAPPSAIEQPDSEATTTEPPADTLQDCAEIDFNELRRMQKRSEVWRFEECVENDLKIIEVRLKSLKSKYYKDRKSIYQDWRATKAAYDELRSAANEEKELISKLENQIKGLEYEILRIKKTVSPTHYKRRRLEEVSNFESELDFDEISRMKRSDVWQIVEGKELELQDLEADVKAQKTAYYNNRKTRRQNWEATRGKFDKLWNANYDDKEAVQALEARVKTKKSDIRKIKSIAYHMTSGRKR